MALLPALALAGAAGLDGSALGVVEAGEAGEAEEARTTAGLDGAVRTVAAAAGLDAACAGAGLRGAAACGVSWLLSLNTLTVADRRVDCSCSDWAAAAAS